MQVATHRAPAQTWQCEACREVNLLRFERCIKCDALSTTGKQHALTPRESSIPRMPEIRGAAIAPRPALPGLRSVEAFTSATTPRQQAEIDAKLASVNRLDEHIAFLLKQQERAAEVHKLEVDDLHKQIYGTMEAHHRLLVDHQDTMMRSSTRVGDEAVLTAEIHSLKRQLVAEQERRRKDANRHEEEVNYIRKKAAEATSDDVAKTMDHVQEQVDAVSRSKDREISALKQAVALLEADLGAAKDDYQRVAREKAVAVEAATALKEQAAKDTTMLQTFKEQIQVLTTQLHDARSAAPSDLPAQIESLQAARASDAAEIARLQDELRLAMERTTTTTNVAQVGDVTRVTVSSAAVATQLEAGVQEMEAAMEAAKSPVKARHTPPPESSANSFEAAAAAAAPGEDDGAPTALQVQTLQKQLEQLKASLQHRDRDLEDVEMDLRDLEREKSDAVADLEAARLEMGKVKSQLNTSLQKVEEGAQETRLLREEVEQSHQRIKDLQQVVADALYQLYGGDGDDGGKEELPDFGSSTF